MGCALATGAGVLFYGRMIETFWLDVVKHDLVVEGWPEALSGIRIAQVSDVHFDEGMSLAFTREVARRIREEIRPDVVAFTGDLTTHNMEHLETGADWLASFGLPTVVCLGNHDYDPRTSARVGCPMTLAEKLEEMLAGTGIEVLRNRGVRVNIKGREGLEGGDLSVAGVEDYYTGLIDAKRAVAGLPQGPKLMLCHNPDAAELVDTETEGGLILAGHSHGGQIRIPGLGALMTNLVKTDRMMGSFRLRQSTLYVSKGVGYLLQARLFCRPEVVVHRIFRKKT